MTNHDQTIPIVFVSNEHYVPYIAVAMQSVIDTAHTDNNYIFYVLHRDISSETISVLRDHIEKYPRFSLHFINVTDIVRDYNLATSGWSAEVYFKLLIPYLLSQHDKILYLDGDVICLADVAELFAFKMDNVLLAAARDFPQVNWYHSSGNRKKRKPRYETISRLKNPSDYFNAGILLFNANEFRTAISLPDLLAFSTEGKFQYYEQDTLNLLCNNNKVLLLSSVYNYMSGSWSNKKCNVPEPLRQDFAEAQMNPKIIHFITKPWKSLNNPEYYYYFWNYAIKTPFFNTIISRMRENGLIGISIRDQIYSRIQKRHQFGFKFIVDCLRCWVKALYHR